MAKAQKKVKIRRLGLGAIFAFNPQNGPLEHWKIIGRPFKDGGRTPEGKKSYSVNAIYVKTDKEDSNVQPDKVFNIDTEVAEVRAGNKDFQAIDQRDQPRGVTPIRELARQVGVDDDETEDDGTLDSLIKDDEEEELADAN